MATHIVTSVCTSTPRPRRRAPESAHFFISLSRYRAIAQGSVRAYAVPAISLGQRPAARLRDVAGKNRLLIAIAIAVPQKHLLPSNVAERA